MIQIIYQVMLEKMEIIRMHEVQNIIQKIKNRKEHIDGGKHLQQKIIVIIEHTETATEAIASPSGVLGSFLASFMALTAHGNFKFIILPVIKAK